MFLPINFSDLVSSGFYPSTQGSTKWSLQEVGGNSGQEGNENKADSHWLIRSEGMNSNKYKNASDKHLPYAPFVLHTTNCFSVWSCQQY